MPDSNLTFSAYYSHNVHVKNASAFLPRRLLKEGASPLSSRTPQRSCRAAHGAKHLPFCAAAIRRRRLSQWGIVTRH